MYRTLRQIRLFVFLFVYMFVTQLRQIKVVGTGVDYDLEET